VQVRIGGQRPAQQRVRHPADRKYHRWQCVSRRDGIPAEREESSDEQIHRPENMQDLVGPSHGWAPGQLTTQQHVVQQSRDDHGRGRRCPDYGEPARLWLRPARQDGCADPQDDSGQYIRVDRELAEDVANHATGVGGAASAGERERRVQMGHDRGDDRHGDHRPGDERGRAELHAPPARMPSDVKTPTMMGPPLTGSSTQLPISTAAADLMANVDEED